MSWLAACVLVVHGLIHMLGFAKAFGYAQLPALTQPISRAWGVLWLVAALLVLVAAGMLGLAHRRFWVVGAIAVVVSQVVIGSAWRDAWAGTIANALLLLLVAHAWLTEDRRNIRP
jgi:hypothetical protein